MINRQQNLQRLLHPKSIAVVGGSVAAEVIRQCRLIGFRGVIWAVNPGRREMEGLHCYASVAELPAVPDASFIAVSCEETVNVVAELAKIKAGGAVCYASGFAEIGAEGRILQEQLLQSAGEMALVGPNCYGLINYLDCCALWPDRQGGKPVSRGVAILTQSGNIGLNLTMQRHHLPIAYMIAVGNKAVTDFPDFMDALLDDERVTAIGLHIEGLTDVARFSQVALKALHKNIPVIALKTGASTASAQVTASHTSSLAGSDTLYDALFKRFGIARVYDLASFIETLKFLHVYNALPGNRIGSMSCSGGDAALVADLATHEQLTFPELGEAAQSALAQTLGPRVPLSNPLDYHTYIWGDIPALTRCFCGMMLTPSDVNLLVLDYPHENGTPIEGWDEIITAYIAAHAQHGKPAIVVSSLAELMPERVAQQLLTAGIAPLQGLSETMTAIRAAVNIGQRRELKTAITPLTRTGINDSLNSVTLDEVSAKKSLALCGLSIPNAHLVTDTEEAVNAAHDIGYPVVIKAVSATLSHKTELGAVKLNIQNDADLQAAILSLQYHSQQFLVETMIQKPVAELIVGVTRDPQFGLALTLGAGGVLVEILRDSVSLLFPVSRHDIKTALEHLRCYKLLCGYRGKPAADIGALLDAIDAIVRYAEKEQSRLQELDVNPLIALEHGAVAVDALIRLSAD